MNKDMHPKIKMRVIENHSNDVAERMREAVKKSFTEDDGVPAPDEFLDIVESATKKAVRRTEIRAMNGQLPKKTPDS